ncbi:MAG: beta-ketoacyl-[acyl-carrier-protein] synthase family protein [Alphaproteobacteria bacterium]|nr:beta-ketoacyl-[acyl-carrier-protein] synthase family protein [Alphaproteobacteria bacterium]
MSRIAVTGAGVVCPLGEDTVTFWESLRAGRSGITRWREADEANESRIGGDMSAFDLRAHLDAGRYDPAWSRRASKRLRSAPLGSRMVVCAARQAADQARLGEVDPERTAHVLAGHNVHDQYLYGASADYRAHPTLVDPMFGLHAFDTDAVSLVCELAGALGPSFLVGTACASGGTAVLRALDLLAAGRADRVLVTGVSSDMAPPLLQALAAMGAIAGGGQDEPSRASRPFDLRRRGFVPAEGAAALVLEREADAVARGATPLALVLGGAEVSAGVLHARPEREHQVRALRLALREAGVRPDDIDYVNAHGTSTPLGDRSEIDALREVLGDRLAAIPVNATKSMLGHAIQAAAVLELVATVLQLGAGEVHPTINVDEPDPELAIDHVPATRPHRIGVAVKNAYGMGGFVTSLVLGAP